MMYTMTSYVFAKGNAMNKDLLEKGLGIEYAAAGWTVAGAIAALVAGAVAGSIALIAYGLDSVIAGVAAGMPVLRLRKQRAEPGAAPADGVPAGKTRFVFGVSFFLVALYLLNESASRLYYGEKPETSMAGVVLAALSVVIMTGLSIMKMRLGSAPEIRPFRDRARETAMRGFLALVLLIGLWLHALYGWWWADPAVALLMIPVIIREGWTAIEASKESGRGEMTGTRTPD
jgi:divalent metal cation (Fe/Co/Zn/Cd) transporter